MIERQIDELKLGDAVHFTGRIAYEDFARYYAEATMAVIPSLYEGFGMPAGEAMACGVPVISTTGGALPEVVGNAGILVPPGDSDALESSILSLLDNPAQRGRIGEGGPDAGQRLPDMGTCGEKDRSRLPGRNPCSRSTIAKLGLEPGMRVLDAGCGAGRHICEAFRCSGVDVVGIGSEMGRPGEDEGIFMPDVGRMREPLACGPGGCDLLTVSG